MTTSTIDRARLEELLGEYWEIAFEESSGVVAIGNKANRVLHEIRALFNKLEAENQRLRAESEERLQNCAALIAENEQLRKDTESKEWSIKDALGQLRLGDISDAEATLDFALEARET